MIPETLPHFASPELMNWSMITCAPLAKSPNCPSQIVRQRGSVVAKPYSKPITASSESTESITRKEG